VVLWCFLFFANLCWGGRWGSLSNHTLYIFIIIVIMEIWNGWTKAGTSYGSDVLVHSIARSDLSLHEISKEQSEFQKAAFQFFTFTKYPIEYVKRVEVIEYGPNSKVRTNYECCRASFAAQGLSTVEALVFHGTPSLDTVRKIVTHGFKVGGKDEGVGVAHGSAHGLGVYTAISPSTPQSFCAGSNALILAKGLRGKQTQNHHTNKKANSVCPNADWIIFKEGCQVLPLYVVHFNLVAMAVALPAQVPLPVTALLRNQQAVQRNWQALLRNQQAAQRNLLAAQRIQQATAAQQKKMAEAEAKRKKKAEDEATKKAEAEAKRKKKAEDEATKKAEAEAKWKKKAEDEATKKAEAEAKWKKNKVEEEKNAAEREREMEAQERALEQATAASVEKYEQRIGEDERMTIAASLGKLPEIFDLTSPVTTSVDTAIDAEQTTRRTIVIDMCIGDDSGSQNDEELLRALQASLTEASVVEQDSSDLQRREDEELAAAIAISQAILDRDPFVSSATIASSSSSSKSSSDGDSGGDGSGSVGPSASFLLPHPHPLPIQLQEQSAAPLAFSSASVAPSSVSAAIPDFGIEIIAIVSIPAVPTTKANKGMSVEGSVGRDVPSKTKDVHKGTRIAVETTADWQCPSCFNINWSMSRSCNQCRKVKPEAESAVVVDHLLASAVFRDAGTSEIVGMAAAAAVCVAPESSEAVIATTESTKPSQEHEESHNEKSSGIDCGRKKKRLLYDISSSSEGEEDERETPRTAAPAVAKKRRTTTRSTTL
jgi:hypothetical protein